MRLEKRERTKWLSRLIVHMIPFSLITTIIFSLSGCTSPIWKVGKPQSDKSSASVRRDFYQKETTYYHNKNTSDGRPKVCLSLSGGGLRSAAYSLGVMRALHETGILEKVDVISAVSGGSYALSWYYGQSILADGQNTRNVFDNPEHLDATVGNTEWVALHESIWRGILGVSPLSRVTMDEIKGRTGVVSMWPRMVKPFSYLWTIPSRGHRSVDGEIYTNQIATTFFPRTKVKRGDGPEEAVIETLQLTRLDAQILNRKLPFFVVNATVQFDTENEGDLPLSQRIFEFTPIYIGGDGVGWKQIKDEDLDQSRDGVWHEY